MITDPSLELTRYRRHMLIFKILTLICLGLLIALDMNQFAQIDRQSAQLTAQSAQLAEYSHAFDNLMDADRRLKEASDRLQEICAPTQNRIYSEINP